MDGLRLPSYGKEFQKDDGLSRSLDSGSDPQWIEVCHPTGGGVVTWARTAAQTSNYGRTTLNRFDFLEFEYSKVGLPLVESIQGIMIRAEVFGQTLPANRAME